MAILRPFDGKSPRLADSAFLCDDAVVVGDVEIGPDSSIWFGSVLRGDVHAIKVGARTNIQDLTVVHVTGGTAPTTIGDDVTVGHRVVLHGCTVKDRCLIGIGSILLDGVVVEEEAMVGAGALVPPGMVVPSHTLVLGAPAKVKRALTPAEIAHLRESAASYAARAREYRAQGWSGR